MYLPKELEGHVTGGHNQNNEHGHRSDNPAIERCRQRRVLHEHQSRLEADPGKNHIVHRSSITRGNQWVGEG